MYYMQKNKNINYNDYLINFGPSYIDELFRLNLFISTLHNNNNYTIDSINDISNNLNDLTLFYIILEGDYYNNALKFLYNYCKNLTIYNLLNYKYKFNNNNIPNHSSSFDTDSEYGTYIDYIINNKKEYNFNNNDIKFPNVVLINIPIAETLDDYNNNKIGKAINKCYDIMRKHVDDNNIFDKTYIYIKTSEVFNKIQDDDINNNNYFGETALLKTILNVNKGLNTNKSNVDFIEKTFISSYNNIEYTLKSVINLNIFQNNNINNLTKMNILSSYNIKPINNLEYDYNSNKFNISNLNNILNQVKNNYNFEKKDINLIQNNDIVSNQKRYLGLLDSNFINYLLLKVLINSYNNYFNTAKFSGSLEISNIAGEQIYEQYKDIEIFDLTSNNDYYNIIFEEIFYELLDKYFTSTSSDFADYNDIQTTYRNIKDLDNYSGFFYFLNKNKNELNDDKINYIEQQYFNKYNRIKNFYIYNFRASSFQSSPYNINDIKFSNNSFGDDFTSENIGEKISNNIDFDNFEKLVSSVFYENILLQNVTLDLSTNYASFDLNQIFDKENSLIADITPTDFSFNHFFNNYNNISLKISDIQNIIIKSNNIEYSNGEVILNNINQINNFENKI